MQKVWTEFGCKTLSDYHDLYVQTDVVLLADVFENFWKVCMGKYALDLVHYYTAPSLSWDALLKKTGDWTCTCSLKKACGVASR